MLGAESNAETTAQIDVQKTLDPKLSISNVSIIRKFIINPKESPTKSIRSQNPLTSLSFLNPPKLSP